MKDILKSITKRKLRCFVIYNSEKDAYYSFPDRWVKEPHISTQYNSIQATKKAINHIKGSYKEPNNYKIIQVDILEQKEYNETNRLTYGTI